MRPSKSLVVGLGNPLQGCDGFGPAVVQRLNAAGDLPSGVELIQAGTDLLALIDRFDAYDLVVLVDAVLGSERREVRVIPEEEFGAWTPHAISAHQASPLVAMGLYRTLQSASTTRVVLVGLLVSEAGFGEEVRPHDVEAGAGAVRRVLSAD